MRRVGRASSPTPTCPRSCKRPGTRAGRRPPCSAARTTPKPLAAHDRRNLMDHATRPIKVGVITDQTGPLSFMGVANANVARMVIDDMNAQGGLLGRPLELYLEDSETTDSAAAAAAAKLVQEAQVDVILGGIYSSTRQ